MDKSDKILVALFIAAGAMSLFMGLNVSLKCAEATFRDNLVAGLPLTIFGIYCLITSFLLAVKTEIGRSFVAVATFAALIMAFASFFDLYFPIINTPCL